MRKFTIAATLCVMFGLLAVGQAFAVEKWTDEAVEPTKVNNVYQVSTPGQLAWFAKESIGKGISHKIKLVADLDLKGKLWLPIGTGNAGDGFKGEFDGGGHTIKNLYIRGEELLEVDEYKTISGGKNCVAQNLGFIGINGGGFIKNLNLENVDIYATNDQGGCGNEISVGGLVGWKTTGGSVIEDVVVSGKIYTSGKGQGVGGIVGNAHSSKISKSVSMVNITADGDSAFVGGIVGLVKNNEVKIDSCVYAGETLESNGAGGKAGAVAGRVYKGNANANMKDVYYDVDLFGEEPVGVVGPQGQGGKISGEASPVSDINNEDVICMLNKGTLDASGECDKQEPWSVGEQNVSWNGSDGFKVTFDADGGSFPENSKTYKMLSNGNAITADEIALPTKDDAAFAGWSLTKGASKPSSNLGVATKPTRVYAVWNPIYTITFDANGGSFPDGSLKKEKGVAKGDAITVEGIGALPEYYCKVYSGDECDDAMYFTGWSFKSNPSTESEIVDLNNLNVSASENTTLYAVWTEVITYTVTFNANGHGKTKVNFVRVEAEGTVTESVDPTADEGYHFDGWFTGNGEEFSFDTPIGASIILYAHWTPVDYTITYVLEDGTNNPENPDTYNIETSTFELAAPTREGYTFEKWYYDEGFSSPATQITNGTTGAKTLYAKWIPNVYTITYRVGSVGHGTVLPSEKEHGKAIDLKLVNKGFELPGYTQTGWTTTDGGEKVYESGASYTDNHDLTLYPTWEIATYTITYVCEVCTGSNPSEPRTYTINDTKEGNLSIYNPTFSSSEYEFKGWYWDENYTKRTTNIPKGALGDTTLYGKMLKKYTISYELNGGTKHNSRTSYTSETTTFALGNATGRKGYTFAGWYANANFEGDAVTEIPLGSTGDKIFYAKWIQEYGAITIVSNIDGTNSAVINGNYTGTDVVEITSNIPVSSVTLDRTFTKNVLSSLFLPFSISASQISGATKIYQFNRVAQNDEGIWKVKVSAVTDLTANTPYMVLPSADGKLTFNINKPVVFNTTTGPETHSVINDTWEFKGVYAHLDFDENFPDVSRVYGFASVAADGYKAGDFVKVGVGADIPAMRAYLVHHSALQKSGAGVHGLNGIPDVINIEIEDENGIVVQTGKLNTVTGEIRMDRWYDLKGRKLNSKPTVKGTYYKNGKRVIVK